MKRIISFIFTLLFLSLYSQEKQERDLAAITIESFKIERANIRSIHVLNKKKMVYAASNGTVGSTEDAGKTWNVLHFKYQDTIVPHFRSLGFNGVAYFALSIGNPALLYKIYKGEISLKYIEKNKNVFYDSLTFFEDKIHGIAVGDPTEDCASILITDDSGENWTKIPCERLPLIEVGEAFFAASNTNIKTFGSNVWIASGGTKARILKSLDFGKTWQLYNTPIIQGNGPQGIYSIDFYNAKNGIIIGGDYSKPQENVANKAITTDGGITWDLVASGKNPNYKSCIQYVPNTKGKEIIAVGKTGISYSKDAGISWQEIAADNYYGIQFIDTNTAWLFGAEKVAKFSF